METKILYGVKYYIEDIGTEFELFKTLSEAEKFWNNKSLDKVRPMKLVKGMVSKNAIIENNSGEILLKNDFDFKTIDTIKTNA
jgi:hypothetical protein